MHVKKGCRKQFPSSPIFGAFAPCENIEKSLRSRVHSFMGHLSTCECALSKLSRPIVCAGWGGKNAHGAVMKQHSSLRYSFSHWTHNFILFLNERKTQPWLGQSLKLETTGYNQSISQPRGCCWSVVGCGHINILFFLSVKKESWRWW